GPVVATGPRPAVVRGVASADLVGLVGVRVVGGFGVSAVRGHVTTACIGVGSTPGCNRCAAHSVGVAAIAAVRGGVLCRRGRVLLVTRCRSVLVVTAVADRGRVAATTAGAAVVGGVAPADLVRLVVVGTVDRGRVTVVRRDVAAVRVRGRTAEAHRCAVRAVRALRDVADRRQGLTRDAAGERRTDAHCKSDGGGRDQRTQQPCRYLASQDSSPFASRTLTTGTRRTRTRHLARAERD